jgi:hypothetical protein
MIGPTDYEIRLKNLEGAIVRILRMLRSIGRMARQGAEGAGLGGQSPAGGGGGSQIFRAIVTTAIPAPANSSSSATNSGRATIQVMSASGAFSTHPDFSSPQVIWNIWPGSSTTASVGKVIAVKYDGQRFTLLLENCS